MDNSEVNFLEINCLKVAQPLGDFFVISIPAKTLLEISFSEPMKYIDNSGNVQGSQRPKDEKRLKDIAKYIDSVEMAFPNSIILAANYTENGNISKNKDERWRVVENDGIYKLIIPKKIKLAAVIDGQHRLNAFEYVTNQDRFSDLQLVCSIYFDLPVAYQAYVFATINSNQKKVDRSLALEQFGYNLDDESEKAWTPEKFAVFISRKLNTDSQASPFFHHIKVAPLNSEILFANDETISWTVSTATIVDGICNLISSNPKRDRIIMQQKSFLKGRSRDLIKDIKDNSPLRTLFIEFQDKTIYDTITTFFKTVEETLWINKKSSSYITKTVGIQALFDILKSILNKENTSNPVNVNFKSYLIKCTHIDFSDKFFQASGIGRNRIKNTIGIVTGLTDINRLKKVDHPFYNKVIDGETTETIKEKWFWEEEAENAVRNALENIAWNYDDKSASLLEDYEYEKIIKFKSYEKLFQKLEEIADIAFVASLPSDHEFADQQRENFDSEDLVRSCLSDYEEELKKLNWLS
jgi:DNA phosphorothioation-associated DGQHR protein 1